MLRSGATFADAAAENLRYAEHDRACKPSTLRDYRSIVTAHLLTAFGAEPVEAITSRTIEQWRAGRAVGARGSALSNRTTNKHLVLLHGILRREQKVYGLPRNPAADAERLWTSATGDIDVFSVGRRAPGPV